MEKMFSPTFSEDEKLSYYLEEIDRIRFRIERLLIMPKHEQWLRREAFMRTAYSSTMIENATITEEEMEKMVKPTLTTQIPKSRQDVQNYTKALSFVDFLSGNKMLIDEGIIRQIHWLLMNNINDTQVKPGVYRTEPNWIEDQGVKVYEPPFHIDVPILMREFSLWLRNDKKINQVLKAGISHAHLIAIHPFIDGNGRTARLLATSLLQSSDYGFRNLLSLDSFYQRNRDNYLNALKESLGKKYAAGYDLTPWLRFFSLSIVVQASQLEQKLTDWRMWVDIIHRDWAPLGLLDREIDGIIYAVNIGRIARKDYMEITGVSPLTATRDLAHLTEKGFFVPKGQGRNRKYYPTIKREEAKGKEEVQEKLL